MNGTKEVIKNAKNPAITRQNPPYHRNAGSREENLTQIREDELPHAEDVDFENKENGRQYNILERCNTSEMSIRRIKTDPVVDRDSDRLVMTRPITITITKTE